MKKVVYKKALVLGIMLVFLTINIIPSVASNNFSSINPITYNTIDSNHKDSNGNNNYKMIWGGNATVDFFKPFRVHINLNCEPDCVENITIAGPDLYLIFLLGTNIKLGYNPILKYPRWARYTILAEFNKGIRYDETRMKLSEPDTKSNILGMGFLIENANNETIIIKMTVTVFTLFPFKFKECERNVTLNIKTFSSNPPPETTL
jgi:hypothetical protein